MGSLKKNGDRDMPTHSRSWVRFQHLQPGSQSPKAESKHKIVCALMGPSVRNSMKSRVKVIRIVSLDES